VSAERNSEHFNQGKARFDEIYNRPDPRDYFTGLRPLAYQTPSHAQEAFRRVVCAREAARGGPVRVLDLCCSYGINAALLNHDFTLDDLYARYTSPELAGLSTDQLAEADRAFYAERRRPDAVPVAGLDSAERAVEYACAAGLLDEGFAEDLENAQPSAALRDALARTDLIIVTGGVGYVFTDTFGRLLGAAPDEVWVAAFVLRTVPYRPVADLLSESGLVTEKLHERTFPQRRFADEAERRSAAELLAKAGLDMADKEATGYYHTELFLSRPAKDRDAESLEEILGRPEPPYR
jgi:SAM-dependent methyltransferase